MLHASSIAALLAAALAPLAVAQGRRPRPAESGQRYSIEQATSPRAQLNTIAFDGLAFLTGDFCCDTFLPPGKVSDFFGFQYMRDVDAGRLGHNTLFLSRIANNMLFVLDEAQIGQLLALAREQAPQIGELARKRLPLIKAFRRNLDGAVPKGSKGLDRAAVAAYSAQIHELSGALAFRRAQVMGSIVRSLTKAQQKVLGGLQFGDSRTWPELPEQFDRRSVPHDQHVALMTYASELFSWYKGSVEADTYFCPEGHGTYFGAFYLKDAPAMGNPGYSISTSLTGDSGEQFLAVLTAPQRQLITSIPDLQARTLAEVVTTRRAIATQLRRFLTQDQVAQKAVLALCHRYGELDGELSWLYATRFAEVDRTLTAAQRSQLERLRNLDQFPCQGAYLYSQRIELPAIPDTDFLFGAKPAR